MTQIKKCTNCKALKPITDFHRDNSRAGGHSNRCKACRCKYEEVVTKSCIACNDIFIVSGNAKARKYCGSACQSLHLKYGIDEYYYENLLISQDYNCAICGQKETAIDKRTGKVYELGVDHCHKTGHVRGLLCTKCNTGLGSFGDDSGRLNAAIEYLKLYSGIAATKKSIQYADKYRR